MCALWVKAVQEWDKHRFFHKLIDLLDCSFKHCWVRWDIDMRVSDEAFAHFRGNIDLSRSIGYDIGFEEFLP